MDVVIAPAKSVRGRMTCPPDKSISHRALILGALSSGSTLRSIASGKDVQATRDCLAALGCRITSNSPDVVEIEGLPNGSSSDTFELHARNSGTTARLLCGLLSGRPGTYMVDGDPSLSQRPFERVAGPLVKMGASVRMTSGGLPLTVVGADLAGVSYDSPVASAQVKGAALIAALRASGAFEFTEPLPSRDHTERLLSWLGVDLDWGPGYATLPDGERPVKLPGFDLSVPADISAAAAFIVAGTLLEGSDLAFEGIGLNQTRTGLLDVLETMGGRLATEVLSESPEPQGILSVKSAPLQGAIVKGEVIPRMIDELPLLAVAATQAQGVTRISEAGELRLKESDRIATTVMGLRALGADIDEEPEGMAIGGPKKLKGGVVDCRGDHRMAMAFAVAGLVCDKPVTVQNFDSVDVSYPGFLQHLESVVTWA